jgi:hypothetical protein
MTPQRIRQLRTSLGLSQSELARHLSVTTTTISFWETGRTSPAPKQQEGLVALEQQACGRARAPAFRPIQYLGSKLKVAHQICDLLEGVTAPGDTVGDLFSGSAAVGSVLTRRRNTVAVDVQGYAAALAEALLCGQVAYTAELKSPEFLQAFETAETRLLHHYRELVALDDLALHMAADGDGRLLDQLITFGSVAAHRQRPKPNVPASIQTALAAVADRSFGAQTRQSSGTAALYFGGVYFSMRQAIALDALREGLDQVSSEARLLGTGVLLSVASELANTVGKQFAQPMRIIKANSAPQALLLGRATRDRRLNVLAAWSSWLDRWEEELAQPRLGGRAVRQDVLAFVDHDRTCAAFYADPPYTVDHYSRFYHVLETLVLRDAPPLDTQRQGGAEVIMRGLYRSGRHQSQFSVPSTVESAFRRLFKGAAMQGRSLILSYSPFDAGKGHRPRLLDLKAIVDLAGVEFRRVEAVGVEKHIHRKLNAREVNVEAPSSAETLIVCEA